MEVSLTVYAEASITDTFVASGARALVLTFDDAALLVAGFSLFQRFLHAFLLRHALRRIDDILPHRTEALRPVRRHPAVVVTLETLAGRAILARELIVGTVNATVAELRDVQANAVGTRQLVYRAFLRAVLAALLVGRIEKAELADEPAIVHLIAQPPLRNALLRVLAVEEAVVITLILDDRALVAVAFVAAVGTIGRQVASVQQRNANSV
jgi:hypothetical protein